MQWMAGQVDTRAGNIPRVRTELTWADHMGACKARWAVGRMNCRIEPGLYVVGDPAAESPVLASANYKMSFDRLRSELAGLDAWILVLDTKGINVWCAAGKGTFGTDELIRRIESTRLPEIVSHIPTTRSWVCHRPGNQILAASSSHRLSASVWRMPPPTRNTWPLSPPGSCPSLLPDIASAPTRHHGQGGRLLGPGFFGRAGIPTFPRTWDTRERTIVCLAAVTPVDCNNPGRNGTG